ncbi:2-oxoglutarate and iron-dependent oxygenase domain-containing protein 2 isoform X1 [Coregonus clupeaformis]|uniref:2-oxoglutarate and iron-dependent oxygenase domain-containing protein 2 isoform X1 n=1 Tax=Coregonus clupeaformis TaxID=59861 RepID=UPI001BE05986|nr:2-oxoglutarate and iron-dependent oxygenase domain-containing protein 2 isoform X1 [Coregonus clupeaformis]XP_041760116.1 2-oxoglutarate and iron-dependent oxygenase domain-containing protein 2 isoform X1 [Coregonus clupeaformis]
MTMSTIYSFCDELIEDMEHFEQSTVPNGRPNTMNNYGILLNELGFDDGFTTPLREQYLQPLTSLLYPECGGRCLNSHKAFIVKYDMHEDLDLSYHYDNAEVTRNVSLQKEFTEGNLYFGDMRQVPLSESVYGGRAESDRGSSPQSTTHAHLLWPALEPHCLDEVLTGEEQTVPRVQQEAHLGRGIGLRRRLHQ